LITGDTPGVCTRIIWQQQLDGGAKAAIAIHHYLKCKTVFASAPSTSSAGCRPCRALNARGIKAEDQPHAKQGALQTRDVPISPRLLWTDAKLLLAAINELNRQGWLGRDAATTEGLARRQARWMMVGPRGPCL
jgi:hypothetical protein